MEYYSFSTKSIICCQVDLLRASSGFPLPITPYPTISPTIKLMAINRITRMTRSQIGISRMRNFTFETSCLLPFSSCFFLAFFISSRLTAFVVSFATNRLNSYLTPLINPSIWSPSVMDFAFIWYERCEIIKSVISFVKSTLDISSAPCCKETPAPSK